MKIKQIEIPQIREDILRIEVEGITPLVTNKNHFAIGAEGSKDPDIKGSRNVKEDIPPEKAFHDSIHWIDEKTGKSGFPARGFKAACVSAALLEGVKKKSYNKRNVRASFFIPADLIEILGTPKMRSDITRPPRGAPKMTYRAEFWPWRAIVELIFAESILSVAEIIQLFSVGGSRIGLGEDRPEKGGSWGRFKVVKAERLAGAGE